MLEINSVSPRSTAAKIGLEPGDHIIAVNGNEVNDVIDFRFLAAEYKIKIAFNKKNGSVLEKIVRKQPDDDMGLEFAPLHVRRCRNRCIFCFVDQMPPGCRRSLYIKDDDFRASFLYGNYITLAALSHTEFERIVRQRLSPLYISVHTTDPGLRAFLIGNTKAPDIMAELRRLSDAGIRMHTQIVLCPGINDGRHLERTISDLAGLFPAVSSVAVAPVGLTSHRKGLFPLRPFTRGGAKRALEIIKPLAARYKRKFGTRLVFPADEFYIKAGEFFPGASFYEDFPQIENGVGMVADFLREAARARLPEAVSPVKITVVTGHSFSRIMKNILEAFKLVKGADVRLITVKNRFFGPSVTVTGLMTGMDILYALKGKRLGDMVILPSNALKEDQDVFIDDMSLGELESSIGVRVVKANAFTDIVRIIREGRVRA